MCNEQKKIRSLIIEILSEVTDISMIKSHTLLLEEGILTSMSILYLVAEVEERLDIEIPIAEIVEENFRDIDCLTNFIIHSKEKSGERNE